MSKTLTQKRATLAHAHVAALLDESESVRAKYATIAHKMPALLRSAGLCQALYFVHSRPDEPQRRWLTHLAEHLKERVDSKITSTEKLLAAVRDADTWQYLILTREAVACADWQRRLVQGVLRIEAAEADKNG